jgi:hypothetical protein
MSADGNHVVIGALNHYGVGKKLGSVSIIDWGGTSWNRKNIYGLTQGEIFGVSVAMSADGTRVVIGATSFRNSRKG